MNISYNDIFENDILEDFVDYSKYMPEDIPEDNKFNFINYEVYEFSKINALCYFEFNNMSEFSDKMQIKRCMQCNKLFIKFSSRTENCLNIFGSTGKQCSLNQKQNNRLNKINNDPLIGLCETLIKRFEATDINQKKIGSNYHKYLNDYILILTFSKEKYLESPLQYAKDFEELLNTANIDAKNYNNKKVLESILNILRKQNILDTIINMNGISKDFKNLLK